MAECSSDQYWSSDRAVAAAIPRARIWDREADVPDPLRLVDFAARPDLLANALRRRVIVGDGAGTPRTIVGLKPSGLPRVFTSLDPVADLYFRQLTWRLGPSSAAALGGTVFSVRATFDDNDAWATVPWKQARRDFKECIRQHETSGQWAGQGHLDVRRHFPTVSLETLRRVLNGAGALPGAVRDVVGFVRHARGANGRRWITDWPGTIRLLRHFGAPAAGPPPE